MGLSRVRGTARWRTATHLGNSRSSNNSHSSRRNAQIAAAANHLQQVADNTSANSNILYQQSPGKHQGTSPNNPGRSRAAGTVQELQEYQAWYQVVHLNRAQLWEDVCNRRGAQDPFHQRTWDARVQVITTAEVSAEGWEQKTQGEVQQGPTYGISSQPSEYSATWTQSRPKTPKSAATLACQSTMHPGH